MLETLQTVLAAYEAFQGFTTQAQTISGFRTIDAVVAEVEALNKADALAVAKGFNIRLVSPTKAKAVAEISRKLTEVLGVVSRIDCI